MLYKTKKEYRDYQKRSRFTSVIAFLYHELFVGFACYTAWMNIWPIIKLNQHLYIHIIFAIIGFFPSISGFLIYAFYCFRMKSFKRAIGRNPDAIVTDGIYSLSRNPGSLGRIIGLIGIGIMGRSYFTLLIGIIWIVINHFYILTEEKHLENTFGDAYLEYYSSTPRYCKVIRKTVK
ncbi:MAG: methyltransferase family protein [Candidatus Hermodarchaeota archaeon]